MRRRSFLKSLGAAVLLGFTNCVPCFGQAEVDGHVPSTFAASIPEDFALAYESALRRMDALLPRASVDELVPDTRPAALQFAGEFSFRRWRA